MNLESFASLREVRRCVAVACRLDTRTVPQTNHFSLFNEIIAVYCENYTKHISMLCGEKECIDVKLRGTYSYHCACKRPIPNCWPKKKDVPATVWMNSATGAVPRVRLQKCVVSLWLKCCLFVCNTGTKPTFSLPSDVEIWWSMELQPEIVFAKSGSSYEDPDVDSVRLRMVTLRPGRLRW